LGEFARTLSIMNRQLDHMVRLIDDLLDVARISGGIFELKKERLELTKIIQTALEMCRPFFEQRKQVVSVQAGSPLFSLADPARLAQIVGNLLHNASKFTPEGGEIRVELTHENGRGVIRVIDSGIGISPEQLDRVFHMFARVEQETRGSNSGLGIGLALSRKLAEMHDGELTVSSPGVGQGSVFTLSVQADTDSAQRTRESVFPLAPVKTKSNLNVLIVEDNQDSAELLAMWLEERGCTTRVAHSGSAALELVSEARPKFILCDIGLPDMDGIEVCRRVRALPLGYRPVMVALTGWGMAEDRRRTKEAGFDHHVVKPVAPETLYKLLDTVGD
jgi:CheY-like chemotaxis protein